MDYTTTARIRQELHSTSTDDETLLAVFATAASRSIDRFCTGVIDPDANNYFALETVSGELLEGQADYAAKTIRVYPHKPFITSVQSFSYQKDIVSPAYSVDPARIRINGQAVIAYPSSIPLDEYPTKVDVLISYSGGLAVSGSALPDDLIDLATMLAIRFYREAETGLQDAIGVAELGTMTYTKALPARVKEGLMNYKRRVGWRHVG